MAPPYSKAYNYFQWAVRQEVLNQGLPWNNSTLNASLFLSPSTETEVILSLGLYHDRIMKLAR